MTTAEMETTATEQTYTMPEIEAGEPVFWYRNGRVDGGRPAVGHVADVHNRTILIRTVDGLVYQGVRHVSDPKLLLSEHHRQMGAWDYTETNRKRREELAELRRRVEALEAALAAPKSNRKES